MSDEENPEFRKLEKGGLALFFAKAPGQVADNGTPSGAVAIRGAASGNRKFDPVTGKFAGGGTTGQPKVQVKTAANTNPTPVTRSGIPQGVTQEEWERRLDLIREASRSGTNVTVEDINSFLEGRVADVSKVDVAVFAADVRAQQSDDLVDALDQQFKNTKAGILSSAAPVRITAGKAWVKAVYGNLQDSEVVSVVNRLQGRGYDLKSLVKNVVGKIDDEQRRKNIESQLGASDDTNKKKKEDS